ncbi:hypothetical protein G6514_002928 [Epicoccum nigrum]|nr:hypothetical protein G6514_002928 [Epicoccum nigrum]
MRQKFEEKLPGRRKIFEGLAESFPDECVANPFTKHDITNYISPHLEQFVNDLCTSKGLYYQTFSKMLKENGIPNDGKGLGRKLNNDILNTMVELIDKWNVSMQGKAHDIAERLDEPSKAVLKALREHVQASEGNREVTNRVSALRDTTIRRSGISYGKLSVQLLKDLREIHLRYSTEVNVKCPIAMEMIDVYRTVVLGQLGQPGPGSYNRQRTHLLKFLTTPDCEGRTLPKVIGQKIFRAQVESWKQCCQRYADEVMGLLEGFRQTIEDMFNNGQKLTEEHRNIRKMLECRLANFERQLD